MKTTFTPELVRRAMDQLHAANLRFADVYPGERPDRQPIQTVYGGAQIFKADTAAKLGAAALRAMDEYAPTPAVFSKALGLKGDKTMADLVHRRVLEKLKREAVEDFRIDFEDGYGNRPDAEEDGHAASSGEGSGARDARRNAAAVHRHPHQAV